MYEDHNIQPTQTPQIQELIRLLDKMVLIWNINFKGDDLCHFDGFSETFYINSKVIEDAVSLIKIKHLGSSSVSKNIDSSTIAKIKDITNCFNEYLLGIPDNIASIAYCVESIVSKIGPLTGDSLAKAIAYAEQVLKDLE